jgi:hypothetical protein
VRDIVGALLVGITINDEKNTLKDTDEEENKRGGTTLEPGRGVWGVASQQQKQQ